MREKELRIALVCYGGISLAVYMHGVTKEIWRLAKASRAFTGGDARGPDSEGVYHDLLRRMAEHGETELRVLVDILAGASAGGINAIFLAHAIAGGHSLDPLTDLWLESADIDRLLDPEVSSVSRFAKSAAVPFAWAFSARSGTVEETVEPAHRAEVRSKLANFVRARWFAPPFGGPAFTNLILDAFDAMEAEPNERPLLPASQPLDLFVTVTDFRGHPVQLRLNSPSEVTEREHRITLAFHDAPGDERQLGDAVELTYAARATASFPGAFPPFTVGELDEVLKQRGRSWPGRDAFLARALPRHAALGDAEDAVLIDGSVLANAPFGPAIRALDQRPARREVDRRFVYIDPKPGLKSVRLTGGGASEPPGFFSTIIGALSDIPREQPIRDNLEVIERLSGRIRRLRRIVGAMQPEVEAAIEDAFGSTFFLVRPTPKRLAAWRARANELAAKSAGYAYASYAHLKIATVVEEAADSVLRLGGRESGDRVGREQVRGAIWAYVRNLGLVEPGAVSARGASPEVIRFLRDFDVGFRTRRLRFIAKGAAQLIEDRDAAAKVGALLNDLLERYQRRTPDQVDERIRQALAAAATEPAAAMEALARLWDLRPLDELTDLQLTETISTLDKPERRRLILSYLGYPFYDVATLPLLQGEGLDEFDPIKVDRISPDDAVAIRAGGTAATLKGIQLNSFGAFFSRAYRENDYLWGRLHGADRLVDILLSTLPEPKRLPQIEVAALKRQAFRAILADEKSRLGCIASLFETLEREVG
ncbi:patatin-like protein [Sphingosinicella sp. CPCC 101087]|uniref:patatin-like protein n=1 Tax=Sphingosinicella sp. CPCC 101087 TaxID=2497754 RepID=UPI00101C5248|nr:patatin-like protein [Sphingosinicella sp. CPCC 101087]